MAGNSAYMKPDNVKRILYGLTMVVMGFLGLALIAFFFLAMSGITRFVSLSYALLFLWAALSGPPMLVAGGALIALKLNPRAATKIALAGAVLVTLWTAGIIGSAILDAMHPSANPAIDSSIHLSDAMIFGILAAATGIIDWAGYRAFRLCRWNKRSKEKD
jgi:hypothetical protein